MGGQPTTATAGCSSSALSTSNGPIRTGRQDHVVGASHEPEVSLLVPDGRSPVIVPAVAERRIPSPPAPPIAGEERRRPPISARSPPPGAGDVPSAVDHGCVVARVGDPWSLGGSACQACSRRAACSPSARTRRRWSGRACSGMARRIRVERLARRGRHGGVGEGGLLERVASRAAGLRRRLRAP